MSRSFRPSLLALEDRALPSSLTVTNLNDSGPGTLRDALNRAASGDTVIFAGGLSGQITLTSGELDIRTNLRVEGPGADRLTISGNDQRRVLYVDYGSSAVLSGLTLSHGNSAGYGGGIESRGPLEMTDCVVRDCRADTYGGGIYSNDQTGPANPTPLRLVNCSIAGNSANYGGGGVYSYISIAFPDESAELVNCDILNNSVVGNGGGVFALSAMTMTGCTVAGNVATPEAFGYSGFGGGVYFDGIDPVLVALDGCTLAWNAAGTGGGLYVGSGAGTTTLRNCTLALNDATDNGGGIDSSAGTLNLTNCTIAGNVAATGGGIDNEARGTAQPLNTLVAGNVADIGADAFGTFASQGHNLIGITDDSSGWVASDLTGTAASPLDPKVGPLQDNGGPVLTVAILAGSPAIWAGDPSGAPATDARGVPRGSTPSIGAYEYVVHFVIAAPTNVPAGQAFDVVVTVVDDQGAVATGYTGTIALGSSDGLADGLGSHTFTPADAGSFTFASVTLYTPGVQYLTADDGSTQAVWFLTVD